MRTCCATTVCTAQAEYTLCITELDRDGDASSSRDRAMVHYGTRQLPHTTTGHHTENKATPGQGTVHSDSIMHMAADKDKTRTKALGIEHTSKQEHRETDK